jgi:hypothetical protein
LRLFRKWDSLDPESVVPWSKRDLSDFWLVSSLLRASYLVFVCLFDVADDDEVFVFDDVNDDTEMVVAGDLGGERLSFDFDDK